MTVKKRSKQFSELDDIEDLLKFKTVQGLPTCRYRALFALCKKRIVGDDKQVPKLKSFPL